MSPLRRWSQYLFRFLILFVLVCLTSCTFVIRTPFDPPKSKKPNWYRGAYHVHSEYSHDSKATLDYIVKTAQKAGLDFVVITDHNNIEAKSHLPNGNDPLLIVGTEISTWHDGHLGVIGAENPPFRLESTAETIDIVHSQGGYVIPAHPNSMRKPWTNWELKNFDGLEVFSFSDFVYEHKVFPLVLKAIFLPASSFLKSVLKVNPKNLERWDELLQSGKQIAGFGSVDAHVKYKIGNFIFENYLMSFQAVTMYVEAVERTEKNIVESLTHGKSFIAFELWGAANEFVFTLSGAHQIIVKAPQPARIRLIHNGTVVLEEEGKEVTFEADKPGYYRAEVYLEDQLWIISNPIYVTEPTAAAVQ